MRGVRVQGGTPGRRTKSPTSDESFTCVCGKYRRESETVARCATLGGSQGVCKESRLSVGAQLVAGHCLRGLRLIKKKQTKFNPQDMNEVRHQGRVLHLLSRLAFSVEGCRFRVEVLGFRVEDPWFGVQGLGLKV